MPALPTLAIFLLRLDDDYLPVVFPAAVEMLLLVFFEAVLGLPLLFEFEVPLIGLEKKFYF